MNYSFSIRKLFIAFSISVALLFSGSVFAYKLNTHVWIAQQIIDDLENDTQGLVEIPIDGKIYTFKVDPALRSAILANKAVYRMGSIGPDASPDVIAGQMLIHPGPSADNPKAMGTDEWAIALENYITNTQNRYNIEDVYKYKKSLCEQKEYNLDKFWQLINTTSDQRNSSSGGNSSNNPWSNSENYSKLLDEVASSLRDDPVSPPVPLSTINPLELAYHRGFLAHIAADTFAHSYVNRYAGDIFSLTDGELEVEKRHAAIESYIDQRIPALPQGNSYDLVQVPAEFIAEAFIFNNQFSEQYKNSGLASYLYALNKYREAVRKTAMDCSWTAISRFAGQAVFYYMTNGAYVPNENQIAAINNIIYKINQSNDYLLKNSQEIKDQLDKNILAAHKSSFNKILSAYDQVNSVNNKILDLDRQVKTQVDRMANMINQKQCNLEGDIMEKYCDSWAGWLDPTCQLYKWRVKTPGCLNYSAYKEASSLRQKAEDALRKEVTANQEDLRNKLVRLRDTMTAVMETTNLAIQATTEVTRMVNNDVDPFKSILMEWDKNITKATVEWVRAHAQVQINSMKPASANTTNTTCWTFGSGIGNCVFPNDSGLEPLKTWQQIYAPALMGVPVSMTQFFASANSTVKSLDDLLNPTKVNSITSAYPIPRLLIRTIEKKVSKELSGINLTQELIRLTGSKELEAIYKDSHAIFYMKWKNPDINNLFSNDYFNKGLLINSTFVDVLAKETVTDGNGLIDTKRFRALNNSLTLAKLTLLDAKELTRLSALLGIPSPTTNYGQSLYVYDSDQDVEDRINGQIALCPTESLARGYCISGIQNNRNNFIFRPAGGKNILYHAIRSIDGHQQWKDGGATLPNRFGANGYNATTSAVKFGSVFGYGLDDRSELAIQRGKPYNKGFRIWQENKNGVYFDKLFKMPIYDSPTDPKNDPIPTVGGTTSSSGSSSSVGTGGCGPNQGKTYATNVCPQSMGSVHPAAVTFCGACGVKVSSGSPSCTLVVGCN